MKSLFPIPAWIQQRLSRPAAPPRPPARPPAPPVASPEERSACSLLTAAAASMAAAEIRSRAVQHKANAAAALLLGKKPEDVAAMIQAAGDAEAWAANRPASIDAGELAK